jgi:hypothetical protein
MFYAVNMNVLGQFRAVDVKSEARTILDSGTEITVSKRLSHECGTAVFSVEFHGRGYKRGL